MTSFSHSIEVSVGQSCLAGVKEKNDDCTGVQITDGETAVMKGVAAVVADGVSAASYGKEAAEMCVKGFLLDYFSTPDSWTVKRSGHKIIDSLNRWLYGQSHSALIDSENGYVSTMSTLILRSNIASIFHIGDTRITLIRDGVVEVLTRDHNSKMSADVTYLNRAMGLNLNPKVDYKEIGTEKNDVFLITSDGVHEHISDKDILESLEKADLDKSSQFLTENALKNGSKDNVTALFVRVDSLPEASHDELQKFLLERPFPPFLYPGHVIDGLEVEKVLHESSRSQLYRVRDQKTDETYAMKTPSVNFSDDAGYIERFGVEEWIGKRVRSSHLVKVLERSTKPRFLYYLMEEISGKNFQTLMNERGGKMLYHETVELIKGLVNGVRALHRNEVIHQDLKLDNVMLCSDGKVKVIDYGSCRVQSLETLDSRNSNDEILGTMEFSAPEYRLGEKGSRQSDLFSIAIITYKMLSGGKHPYNCGGGWAKAKTPEDFRQLVYKPLSDTVPDIPLWADGALSRALLCDPAKRYEALSEFVRDFEVPSSRNVRHNQSVFVDLESPVCWKIISAILFVIVIIQLVIILK